MCRVSSGRSCTGVAGVAGRALDSACPAGIEHTMLL